jgi:hypothetical protein
MLLFFLLLVLLLLLLLLTAIVLTPPVLRVLWSFQEGISLAVALQSPR